MIEYHYEIEFALEIENYYTDWIGRVIKSENRLLGEINYIFCSDKYLLDLNQRFLKHDTLTDIITFDYSDNNKISGDIFISVERVKDNAKIWGVSLDLEIKRVMVHGLLHLMGYNDKTDVEQSKMREMEELKMKLFHVEQ